jgi:tRNA uridine 5-carboxymethylaminomethyl modification enzyme
VEIRVKAQNSRQQSSSKTENALNSDLSFGDLSFELLAPAVVLTTGTFMRGLMHTGEKKSGGGRFGEAAAVGISGALRKMGFELGRLKTGTPPRLNKRTIDWEELKEARGDEEAVAFSDLSREGARGDEAREGGEVEPLAYAREGGSLGRFPVLPQVECRETSTSAEIHELIRANLHRAPMYSGQIESVGPRYCPSIEDKVVRFAERESHTVFLEPESLRPGHEEWIYCNGISTSLPADVQDRIVRAMPGCARAEIMRYGYAVEYDMVRPHQILATGMTKLVEGLFLAGQINGTSGYEEAGAQGLVAGVNAARFAAGQSEWVVGREQAYIGVLMDDLVTKTPVEPYRMFTSRAEHRLLLRADNAADRLTPVAEGLGLLAGPGLGAKRREVFARRRECMGAINRAIDAARVNGEPLSRVMRRPGFEVEDLTRVIEETGALKGRVPRRAIATVFADRKYEAYVERQKVEIRRSAEIEGKRLPREIDYLGMPALRPEARLALAKFRPATFGQAGRLEGITPADLTLLSVLVSKAKRNGRRGIESGAQADAHADT